ncbi:NirD/YgiW/YdeI family stress tolerance protein [Endozoicomonas sp. SM1973]|uniref:NirD/YgiW/YdeI family stress tolerance protein n=1 Tax=Spartinivicinus marinus TaxID=2994442 RepID=A0A853I395_9GAMM|nr:NirD/YgiW/YdeI family stress tolerance protein [Spartinivicinus marinus]MCX4027355.1 NirD/YgiW/YdeI family stress tolerance protein [Spartinivicinus marinus]NYZ68420.1 NirD/YgiW/YdeI family stress tolerance protein [Spartinivicinus marinus]
MVKVITTFFACFAMQVFAQVISTVAGVKSHPVVDQKIVMQGYIVKQLSHETYLFKDQTGQVQVEIDIEEWPQEQPLVNKPVEIIGEVEVESNGPIGVDVEEVRPLNVG